MSEDEPSRTAISSADDRSVRTSFEPDESPSEAVVMAVAALTNTDPTELKPLYDAVDPDALDALFRHAASRERHTNHRVSFLYHGFDVRVRSDGAIRLERSAD